ncbi:MAG: DUF4358 domain-containing protein [Ruminococcus sp.]|nr:DUF4358 domain-containing protein [Ruminococcus sp.]
MKKKALAAALILMLGLSACGNSDSSASPALTKASDAPAASAADESKPEDTSSSDETSQPGDSTDEKQESKLQSLADELIAAYPDALNASVVYGSELFEKNCKKLYACEAEELTDAMIAFNNGGGLADEVSIVFPADGDTEKQIKMFEARKQIRYNDFNGYAPEELPKIEAAKTFTAGDAAVLVISDNADEIEKLIKEKLG